MTRRASAWVPDRADIIFIEHDPRAGDEIPGLHPLLVCTNRVFNEKTGLVLGFPMTHSSMHSDNPFALRVEGPRNELGYVLAFQPKSFDWRARRARPHRWGGGHKKLLETALATLDTICGICPQR